MTRGKHQCFAIVRVDEFALKDAAIENAITVKGIVWSQEEAEREVARLNGLNAERGCRYFWQVSRAAPREITT